MATTQFPPHLPRPDNNGSLHSWTQRIYVVGVSVVLSLAAGVVGALSVFAWIIPGGYADGGVLVSRGQGNLSDTFYTEPEISVIRKVKNVTTDVFLKNLIPESGYYGDNAYVGNGVMLTSNGWGVVYAPQLMTSGSVIPSISVRDVQGIWYTPDLVVPDKKNGLIYFKLTGTEFYVMSFPDWRSLTSGTDVWTYRGREWRGRTIGDMEKISKESVFMAVDERIRFVLSPMSSVNTGVVLSEAGEFIGFSDADGVLHDAWIIQYSIQQLLESGSLEKTPIEWRGSMVETMEEGKIIKGFAIDQVGEFSKSELKRGDIIRAINSTPVSEMNLYRLVRETSLTATIWRDGRVFDILISN